MANDPAAPQGEDPRVEELRAQLADAEKRNMRSLCTYCGHIEEAADEIERFDRMADHMLACEKHPIRMLVALRVENQRLREALETIAGMDPAWFVEAVTLARAALDPSTTTP